MKPNTPNAKRRDAHPDNIEEDIGDWYKSPEYEAFKNRSAAAGKQAESYGEGDAAGDDDVDAVDLDGPDDEGFSDDHGETESDRANGKRARDGKKGAESEKSFFETLGDGLRNAGDTAKRYTRIGLARAQLEKLRFDLKSAYAHLGEVAMHCWADAPDLGLSSKDPAVVGAIKRIRVIRRKIREKQAAIAELRKERE